MERDILYALGIFESLHVIHGINWCYYFLFGIYADRAFYGYVTKDIYNNYTIKLRKLHEAKENIISEVLILFDDIYHAFVEDFNSIQSKELIEQAINKTNENELTILNYHAWHLQALVYHFSGEFDEAEKILYSSWFY